MRKTTLVFVLAAVPSLAVAQQATTSAQGSASASVTTKTPRSQATVSGGAQASTATTTSADIPSNYSAENRAKLDATYSAAREKNLPQQPIRDRVAEGRARGATEAQIVLAAQHTESRLEVAQHALIQAGRPQPSQAEVASANDAMVRGASDVQIQAIARHTPSDRSLVVAIDALTRLEAQGIPADRALAQITAQQNASASDQAIGQLQATTNASVNGVVAAPRGSGASVAGSATAAATTTGQSAAGASAGVTGAVGAVIKKPPF